MYALGFLPISGPFVSSVTVFVIIINVINPYRKVPKLFVSKTDPILNADKSSFFTFRISRLSLILIVVIVVTETNNSVGYVRRLDVKYEIIV